MPNDLAPCTELSLFSGAGGGLLGTTHLLGWRTVCYVEWDRYAVEVLKARIRDGYLHDAPIWDDAFSFDGRPWAGLVDVVTAGFPCQPFSVAGKGLAENDPRNGWPAVIRILREVRPRFALLENVPGLVSKPYFQRILGDLSEAGFDTEWGCVSAEAIGANHKRERLWMVAHAAIGDVARRGYSGTNKTDAQLVPQVSKRGRDDLPNPESIRQQGERAEREQEPDPHGGAELFVRHGGNRSWWAVEPELGRVADGVAHRVDRLKAIGNGQVPAVVREAWNRLSGVDINDQ